MAGQVLNADGSLHRFVNVYVNDDDVRYLSAARHAGQGRRRGVDPAGRRRRLSRRWRSTAASSTSIGNTPMVDISQLSPNPDGPDPHQAGGPEPRRLGEGPGGALARRGRPSATGSCSPASPASPHRADVGQHRHRPRPRLPGEGLPPEGGPADQRLARAPPAARGLGGRDHRVARARGVQRRGPDGPAPGGRAPRVGLPLPVRRTPPTPRPTTRTPGPRSGATAPRSPTSWPASAPRARCSGSAAS